MCHKRCILSHTTYRQYNLSQSLCSLLRSLSAVQLLLSRPTRLASTIHLLTCHSSTALREAVSSPIPFAKTYHFLESLRRLVLVHYAVCISPFLFLFRVDAKLRVWLGISLFCGHLFHFLLSPFHPFRLTSARNCCLICLVSLTSIF